MKKKLKVLVTGGAGFVGSHFVESCLGEGHEVTVFDNFSRGRREFLPDSDSLDVQAGDILNPEDLDRVFVDSRPDVVVHLAAIHYIPECEKHPSQAIRMNIEGTQNVLNACVDRVPRVVFASTGAIYDPALTGALTEESAIQTGDVYGITKLACEELVRYHARKGRGSVVVARLFNAVGTRETNPHLIPEIAIQLADGRREIELGNLYPKRDYVHVDDIGDALTQIVSNPNTETIECYNIGSGIEYSVGELIDLWSTVLGESVVAKSVPDRCRKVDRTNQLSSTARLSRDYQWKPKRDLETALKEIWREATTKGPGAQG